MAQTKLLFICLGNICRSPSAEAVMKKIVRNKGLEEKYTIDSAGMIGHHEGEEADSRMKKHARKRDIQLQSIARQVRSQDFSTFDYLFTMDQKNIADLKALAGDRPDYHEKIYPMCRFCRDERFLSQNQVPDPYFGGADGFELVLDLLEDACEGLVEKIESGEKL